MSRAKKKATQKRSKIEVRPKTPKRDKFGRFIAKKKSLARPKPKAKKSLARTKPKAKQPLARTKPKVKQPLARTKPKVKKPLARTKPKKPLARTKPKKPLARTKPKAKQKLRKRPETPSAIRRRIAREILEISKDWVSGVEPQYLHRNGTLALYPTLLRHLPTKYFNAVMREAKPAVERGDLIGLTTLTKLAEGLQVPLRELYTLVMSP